MRAWKKNPHVYSQLIFDKVSGPLNGERIVSSNSAEKTGCPHAKKLSWSFIFQHTEITSKWLKDLNKRHNIIKPLKENTWGKLHDIGLGDGFLHMTPTE